MSRAFLNRSVPLALALIGALALAACGSSSSSGGSGDSGGGDQFTTASLQKSLDAVKKESGENTELLEIQITAAGTDYTIRSGEQATGLHFDPGSGDGQDVDVNLIGAGSVADSAFPISEVDPAAIDTMVSGAPSASGVSDWTTTAMTLGNQFTPDLGWTVNGEGAGRTGLVLQASPDGSGLKSPTGAIPGGEGTGGAGTTTEIGGDPQAIADCIQKAGGDVAKIQACAGQ